MEIINNLYGSEIRIRGINKDNILKISKIKNEDDWITDFRIRGYNSFINQSMPSFGPKIDLDFNKIIYYKSNESDKKIESDWNL